MPETTSHWVQYHVLPDEPVAALNILREAAGLEPLSSPSHNEPEDADGGTPSTGKASNDWHYECVEPPNVTGSSPG